jgi:hypothetical protein
VPQSVAWRQNGDHRPRARRQGIHGDWGGRSHRTRDLRDVRARC